MLTEYEKRMARELGEYSRGERAGTEELLLFARSLMNQADEWTMKNIIRVNWAEEE